MIPRPVSAEEVFKKLMLPVRICAPVDKNLDYRAYAIDTLATAIREAEEAAVAQERQRSERLRVALEYISEAESPLSIYVCRDKARKALSPQDGGK